MEGADKLGSQLEDLAEADDIPEEILSQFVDHTQDFFDSYVTSRVELMAIQEMEDAASKQVEEKRRTRRRRLGENIPEPIAEIMLRANDEFLGGNFLRATAFAEEAIELEPRAAEPYNLLAMIAEENKSPDVALTFLVKAAERTTDSAELWAECSRLAQELGKMDSAIAYLREAAKLNSSDTTALMELYELLSHKVTNNRMLVWTLNELVKRDPLESHFARELAEYQYQSGQTIEALNVLKLSVEAQMEAGVEVDMANANLLSSSYLNEGMNDDVLQLDARFEEAPVDFRVNAAIALIRKRDIRTALPILERVSTLRPSEYIDAFKQVAEELMEAAYMTNAADWLQLMQSDGIESREDIAYCLVSAGRIDEAVAVLQELIVDLPHLPGPAITFYQVMKDAGREEEAGAWLDANCPEGRQSDAMVLNRAIMANARNDDEEFMNLSTLLICRVLYDLYQMQMLKRVWKIVTDVLGLTAPMKMKGVMMKVLRYRRSCSDLFPIEQEQFFSMACGCLVTLYNHKRLEEAFALGGLLVIASEKLEKKQSFDVLFMFALISFSIGEGSAAIGVMRGVLLEDTENDIVWEFFNVFLQNSPDKEVHTHKFLLRTLGKMPDCAPLQIMLGNHSQSTVWFDHAITQYLNVFRDKPEEPIVSLLLATSYLSKAYVRTQKNPRKSVLAGYAAIRKYVEVRRDDFPVEADYNMGRFYQSLRMYPQAERMYRLVLESPIDYELVTTDFETHDLRYNLRRDAAHNLVVMLRDSNPNEARRIMRKYLSF